MNLTNWLSRVYVGWPQRVEGVRLPSVSSVD
jgi:hypothetical protein